MRLRWGRRDVGEAHRPNSSSACGLVESLVVVVEMVETPVPRLWRPPPTRPEALPAHRPPHPPAALAQLMRVRCWRASTSE
jgi:hypothetical protein